MSVAGHSHPRTSQANTGRSATANPSNAQTPVYPSMQTAASTTSAPLGPHLLADTALYRGYEQADFYNSLAPVNEASVVKALESSIVRNTRFLEEHLADIFREFSGEPVAEAAEARIEQLMRDLEHLIPPPPQMFTLRQLNFGDMLGNQLNRRETNKRRRANDALVSTAAVLDSLAEHQVPEHGCNPFYP